MQLLKNNAASSILIWPYKWSIWLKTEYFHCPSKQRVKYIVTQSWTFWEKKILSEKDSGSDPGWKGNPKLHVNWSLTNKVNWYLPSAICRWWWVKPISPECRAVITILSHTRKVGPTHTYMKLTYLVTTYLLLQKLSIPSPATIWVKAVKPLQRLLTWNYDIYVVRYNNLSSIVLLLTT